MTAYLRMARINDHWRKLYKKRYSFSLKEIQVQNGSIFNNLILPLSGNLNVIIGKNGVGKTNFLRNIFNALNKDNESNRGDFTKLLDKSNVIFKYKLNTVDKEYQFFHQDDSSKERNADILSFIFDPCCLIPELQNLFSTQQNLDEILEQFEAVEYPQEKIEVINFLSNHTYTNVAVYNIEDEYENFPVLPIFSVRRDGLDYDSRAMGLGELSMLYFFWMLDYVSNLNRNIVVIVEEPESFISPLLQQRFISILVKYIVEKNLNCIVSTHSDYILNKIPASSLKKLTFTRESEYTFSEIDDLGVLSTLGLSPPKKGILFFEDQAAEILLKQLIKKLSLNANENFYFHCSGDDSHVVSHINEMPKNLNNFRFVGVFDGDARNKVPQLLTKDTIYTFLPTDMAPEQIIINYLSTCNFGAIDSFLHLESGKFEEAYQTAVGADHHEIFKEISKILDTEFSTLFNQLCEIWIRDSLASDTVQEFIKQFDSIFF